MKLGGFINPKGKVNYGQLVNNIINQSRYCLFEIKFVPNYNPDYLAEFANLFKEAITSAKLPGLLVFMHGIDPFANTISICPPIVNKETGIVSFDPADYDKAIRDQGWPVDHMDCGPITRLVAHAPNANNKIAIN